MSVKFIMNGYKEPTDVVVEASEGTWKRLGELLGKTELSMLHVFGEDEALDELLLDIHEAGNL